MLNDNLKHHGVKGQKWGIRRFQNKDGSLTPDGYKRYGSKTNLEKEYPQDVKKSLSKTKNAIDKSNNAINTAKKFNDKRVKKAAEDKIKTDLSKLSDQDLQKIVNRLNMEERYKQVMNSREAELGKDRVGKVLEYAGTVLTVGTSAITLLMKIQEMKKK